MVVAAKVVSLNERMKFSALTVGAVYPIKPLRKEEALLDLGYDFTLIDDEGYRMPFCWENDIEAEFERVEL